MTERISLPLLLQTFTGRIKNAEAFICSAPHHIYLTISNYVIPPFEIEIIIARHEIKFSSRSLFSFLPTNSKWQEVYGSSRHQLDNRESTFISLIKILMCLESLLKIPRVRKRRRLAELMTCEVTIQHAMCTQ